MKKIIYISALALLFFTGCDKEFTDPSRPDVNEVYTSRDGLIGVANGLQQLWSIGRQSPVYASVTANGFSTQELRILNIGNADEAELAIGGGTITSKNGVIKNLWTQALVTKSEAQKVIDNVSIIENQNERENLIVHASIFKALALGTLIQYFEKVPITTAVNAPFNTRAEVLTECINTLRATIPFLNTANGFSALINSIKYKNTVNALLARYYLMAGDNDNALIYANLVTLSGTSTFLYDTVRFNPIADSSIATNNNFQPANTNLGLATILAPAAADGRKAFYTAVVGGTVRAIGFFNTRQKLIPVYLPGEVTLIKAEAFARKNQLTDAKIELDKILVKTAALDAYGIGANLPPYAGSLLSPTAKDDILLEIYKNRCIELFMSNSKLEDSRRFNRPSSGAAAERNRTYYPYPDSERFNNSNTPEDPAN
jgi:starch-binding outer membrane protein, SusD/RagB family